MTHFAKPALTAHDQLDLLIERGLHINDRERALRLLEVTTSFRLSPYMRPFQYPDIPRPRWASRTTGSNDSHRFIHNRRPRPAVRRRVKARHAMAYAGIVNDNEFCSEHYLADIFEGNIRGVLEAYHQRATWYGACGRIVLHPARASSASACPARPTRASVGVF